MNAPSSRSVPLRDWLHAFRLRTLPLAVSSILVGGAVAYKTLDREGSGPFDPVVLVLALLTAILLQVLSNLANDLGDHQHGTDGPDRIGPQRAVQSGAIPPATMKRAMVVCGLLAFICGTVLVHRALGMGIWGLLFLFVGTLAILAAIKYTFGASPYGYAGLGDISVFLFFGLVGVLGTFFLFTERLAPPLLPAIALGLLSTGVLHTNNMRDVDNDAANGKRTMAVRLGRRNARLYHALLVLGALACLLVFTWQQPGTPWKWLFLPTLVLPMVHLRNVLRTHDPALLDPELKRSALGTFVISVMFSFAHVIS